MLIILRGGGDLGSGVGIRLHLAGFQILITEIANPLAVRRLVSFSEAVYDGTAAVEGITARLVDPAGGSLSGAVSRAHQAGEIPLIIDPDLGVSATLGPAVLVDCRMTKNPPGPLPEGFALVVGLGPGFAAGENCHAAVETNRGHNLGRVFWEGRPEEDTGEPDMVSGHSWERVLRAPCDGELIARREIGSLIGEGDEIAAVADQIIRAKFAGALRGILRTGALVQKGVKVGDLDPRGIPAYCWTVSDKARAIGGGVLEAVMVWRSGSKGALWT